ncbi:CPBP family intramembrane metalloprotease [Thalassococcus sp. CAU 1522]|uniref:CPBP family intramembrane metalloprotease n=1 Tax=Thalassococcus arenae TaxID=2851652 RepID=A0ABS6N459_9RHOB|nr:type II CAAX endopeptidase family protein [Thalassococcus arenae]MBV2358808.1 CPBP family intramembrane metalloprotease [Thalassococcus arenae]
MRTNPTSPTIASRTLALFLLIAFGLAWGIFVLFALFPQPLERLFGPPSGSHPLFVLAVYAPAIAGLSLVVLFGGFGGLKRFLSRLLLWRIPLAWLAFLVIAIPAIFFLGAALKGGMADHALPFDGLGAALTAIAFMLVLGPMEEFGWRGYALPILQRHMVPALAGAVLGLIWGVWHLPAFLLSGTPQSAWDFTPFLVGSVAVSVILTPLFNASRGSILIAALFHFQLNNPLWPDGQPYDMWIFAITALVVVWLNRGTMFVRGGVTEIIPLSAGGSPARPGPERRNPA